MVHEGKFRSERQLTEGIAEYDDEMDGIAGIAISKKASRRPEYKNSELK
jgi:hypothetical protein